jgi:hypothetical protein
MLKGCEWVEMSATYSNYPNTSDFAAHFYENNHLLKLLSSQR